MGGGEVDPSGMVHLEVMARWMQEIAVADALDADLPEEGAWIIRRATARVERMPRFPELLELRTWCSGIAASVAARRTTIAGDLGARVEAEAIWVHVDPGARRPIRLPESFRERFGASAAGERPRTSLRHPAEPPDSADALEWRFGESDLDLAGHVNNTIYWRLAEELLDGSPLRASTPTILEAEFRAGIGAGTASVRRAEGMLWVGDTSGRLAGTLRLEPA